MGLLDLLKPKVPTVQSILPQAAVNEIMCGRLPILITDRIFLKGGEKCHYSNCVELQCSKDDYKIFVPNGGVTHQVLQLVK